VPRVTIPADLQRYTGGAARVEVNALSYRDLVDELSRRFPALTPEIIRKQAIAIDGMVIHEPLLESFLPDSELVLVPRIAGG
jgi:molybdopterin converting factor small subunit